MPKISAYPDGSIFAPTDELIIARSGKNYSILGSEFLAGKFVLINPVYLVDSAATSWNNYAAPVGTYDFNLQDANHNLPSGISAVFIRCSARWAAASNSTFLAVKGTGLALSTVGFVSMVASIFTDEAGVVRVGTNDDIQIQIAGANAQSAYAVLIGYFL